MKIRKLAIMLLVIGLMLNGLNAQQLNNLSVETELKVEEHDTTFINPIIVFTNLDASQLAVLSEIYIEFTLTAEISHGTSWPDLVFAAFCIEPEEEEDLIGRIDPDLSDSDATHYLRITDKYLRYDPVSNNYFFEFFGGFCDMIGYVDIILNGHGQIGSSSPNTVYDYCVNISMSLDQVLFLDLNGNEAKAVSLGSDQLSYGVSDCQLIGFAPRLQKDKKNQSNADAKKTECSNPVLIYPNPTSNHLFIESASPIDKASLRLYGIDGRLLKNQDISNSKNRWLIQDLEAGIYWLQITSEDQIYTHKIVVTGKL